MNNRRKPFELQMKKNQYRSHLKKLQQIAKSDNQLHRNILKERQEIDAMIRNSHQLHSHSMKFELRKREKTELESQRANYDNVRSCLKQELNRKLLTVPQRHKPDSYLLDIANMKLVNKIVNVKSQFNFKDEPSSRLEKLTIRRKQRVKTNQDFTNIYKESMVKNIKVNQICLRINKSKENVKIKVRFLDKQSFLPSKSENLYYLTLESSGKKRKSKNYPINELFSSDILLDIPLKDCSISFWEKLGEKNVLRYKIELHEKDLCHEEDTWVSKGIEDGKGRAVGVAEIELKKKKNFKAGFVSDVENIVVQESQKTSEITQNQTNTVKA